MPVEIPSVPILPIYIGAPPVRIHRTHKDTTLDSDYGFETLSSEKTLATTVTWLWQEVREIDTEI